MKARSGPIFEWLMVKLTAIMSITIEYLTFSSGFKLHLKTVTFDTWKICQTFKHWTCLVFRFPVQTQNKRVLLDDKHFSWDWDCSKSEKTKYIFFNSKHIDKDSILCLQLTIQLVLIFKT